MSMTAIDDSVIELAASVLRLLGRRGLSLAVAESLTGGELAATLVSVPGASDVFQGGIVSYTAEVKASVLGVSRDLLAARGTVHPDVAEQMAEGACRVLGTDVALATTGVAGPGPSESHPAGTVYVALRIGARSTSRGCSFDGDRAGIRAQAVRAALNLLMEELGE